MILYLAQCNFLKIITFALFILICSSCNKSYNVEYLITNRSTKSIHVIYQKNNSNSIDTNVVANRNTLIFLIDIGDDQSSYKYLENLSKLPVKFIQISNFDGHRLICNEEDLSCWHKTYESGRHTIGQVYIDIFEDSFN
ncbi:MAG: hypothetical protein ABIO44_00680 [Saprospiraceae bacterium]